VGECVRPVAYLSFPDSGDDMVDAYAYTMQAMSDAVLRSLALPPATVSGGEAGYASSRLAGAFGPWRRGQMIREALGITKVEDADSAPR
jgi:hypothetical protein